MNTMVKRLLVLTCLIFLGVSAFGQIQILEKKNKSVTESHIINPEFEIFPNIIDADYNLNGKSISYFFYEPGKSASDFAGDLYYLDLGNGVDVTNNGYVDIYFYDLETPVTTGKKKANIACVIEFKNCSIIENLYASLEIAIYYKWNYYGYTFDESDDWSNIDEYDEVPSRDYMFLNRYVTFWDSIASKCYTGYYPQTEAYDNVIYVDNSLTTGANDGTSWANAYRGADAFKNAVAKAKTSATPSDYVQIWLTGKEMYQESVYVYRIPGNLEIIGGFMGTETHAFERNSILYSTFNGDIGVAGDTSDNLQYAIEIETCFPVYIEGLHITEYTPFDVQSALNLNRTNVVVKNVNSYRNYQVGISGSDISGGAGLRFSDKYEHWIGMSLIVENSNFLYNTGQLHGAGVSVNNCHKRSFFINCNFIQNEGIDRYGNMYVDAGGLFIRSFQSIVKDCTFENNTPIDFKQEADYPASRKYADYHTGYNIVE